MMQQGKQMRVGARKGLAYNSVKLVLLANGNKCDDDSNTYFESETSLHSFNILPCSNSGFFDTNARL
jgi:hypothetical protein